jgi:hydroxymethylbilane synthase
MQMRLRIGTRGSPLALYQAREVAARLAAQLGEEADKVTEIVVIKTTGDRVQDRNLSELGGKGLFTKEIEDALLAGDVDLAVHSMKDMPSLLPKGLVIDCLLEREDPRDAFVSHKAASLSELPKGAVIGTSSLRRAAQIRAKRPDLSIVSFRGNVETRLMKLERGVADATLLAMAGLNRMGLTQHARGPVSPDDMLPAVAQGAIGVERRENDATMAELLSRLHHPDTGLRVGAERALLRVLEGSCRSPIAAYAELHKDRLVLRGELLLPDGSQVLSVKREGAASDAIALGEDAGAELKGRAGPEFFAKV